MSAIGPLSFLVLTWGAVGAVFIVFGYIVATLVGEFVANGVWRFGGRR